MSRRHIALDRHRWFRVRRIVLDRDGWRCRQCGKAGVLEVHHRVPLQLGGAPFDLDNLQTVCRSCHLGAHGARPEAAGAKAWRALVAELSEF